MTCINYNVVNNISECILLHDKINPNKRTKNLYSHYSPILHGCMNTRNGKSKLNNFQITLYSVCSSTFVMVRLVEIHLKEDFLMQWHTKSGNITTNLKVEVGFT